VASVAGSVTVIAGALQGYPPESDGVSDTP
jgi:hypothetical protein